MHISPSARIVNPQSNLKYTINSDELDGHRVWRLSAPRTFAGNPSDAVKHSEELVCLIAPEAGWNLIRGEMRDDGEKLIPLQGPAVVSHPLPVRSGARIWVLLANAVAILLVALVVARCGFRGSKT